MAVPTENLPRSRGGFLLFLRKVHAWVGVTGASLGLLFGLTGFLMSHRSTLKIQAGQVDERKVQIELEQPPATIEALAEGLAVRFGVPLTRLRWRVQAPRPARFGGQAVTAAPVWTVQVMGTAHFARATYLPWNRTVDLEQSDASLLAALQRLHRVESGQAGWILLADAFVGSLIFMFLSGTLIWTRLAGPRLLSLALALGGALTAALIASRAW
jgi:uncharacterized protein